MTSETLATAPVPSATATLRVLVIGDAEESRTTLAAMLIELGAGVELAESGQVGLERFAPERHDLVITDWQLAELSGLEVIAQIRRRAAATPVVLVTGRADIALATAALRAGALDFLTKPVRMDDVAACYARARQHHNKMCEAALNDAARRADEASLSCRLDLQQKVLDAIAIPVFCLDPERRYLAVNQAFERFFGVDRAERLGKGTGRRAQADEQAVCHDQDPALLSDGGLHVYEGTVGRADGSLRRVVFNKSTFTGADGRVAGLVGTIFDLTEERRAEENRARLETAVEQAAESVLVTDRYGTILYVNPAFERATGYAAEEVVGRNPRILKSGQHEAGFYARMWATLLRGEMFQGRWINKRKDGSLFEEEGTISPIKDADGEIVNFVAVKRDVSELAKLRAQLLQSQKLEAIGQLAAGIAHEINTPTQFIGDNLTYLHETFHTLDELVHASLRLYQSVQAGAACPEAMATIARLLDESDVELLLEDAPLAIEQSLGGVERVARIVRATKEFSHPGGAEKELVDLNRALENTATVARNEWKQVADLVYELDPDLSLVPCLPGEMNQVFLNLIVNAAHAIQAASDGDRPRGTITVTSRAVGPLVEVRIADTGCGIPERDRDRIFDPFFTTKEVGHGTGQGLAIARSVVVDKHDGSLTFESQMGQGTTFIIRLPRDETTCIVRGPGLIEE